MVDPTAPRPVTHDVENQAPPLVDFNLYETDRCLFDAVAREGAGWAGPGSPISAPRPAARR
jgi:hypothetical protein